MCKNDDSSRTHVSNDSLVEGAGKITLEKANMWGRGIVHDIKTTVGTHWRSEMTNFNQKTVAVTFLLFISVIAPTLTFGAVYGKITESNIGAIETIMGSAWVGIFYALFGGMPICVIGSTGPILAFTTVVFNLSKSLDVPFLPFNAWVSVWLFIYIALAAFFDLTRFVRLATRFTDDVFAFLIVCIFVMDAVGDPFSQVGLLRYFDPDHKSHDEFEDDPDYDFMEVALLSVILGLGTTSLTFFFRSFQNSSFFCNDGFRGSIHDFAVSMSVLIWSMIKIFAFPDIETEKLDVPGSIEPSLQCCDTTCTTSWPLDCPDQEESFGTRSWIVNLGDVGGKSWVPFVAAGPAALAFVLIFLDNGITWHLIYHKSHMLQHGESYNWDLLLSGIFNVINGMLGLPWLVATTVPCLIHLNGLATKDTTGKFLSVQETRLTGLFAHVIMGMSLLVLPALKLIPVPVLYGVFLFMGLASLAGIQFWNRLLNLLRQPSLYPSTIYNKYMDNARVHKYTGMQFIFFCGVFIVIHMKAIAIIFPLFTLLCIPARLFLFPKMFAGWELLLLDGEDEDIAEWVEAKENATNNGRIMDDSDVEGKAGKEEISPTDQPSSSEEDDDMIAKFERE